MRSLPRGLLCLAAGFCLLASQISMESAPETWLSGGRLAAFFAGAIGVGFLLLAFAPAAVLRRVSEAACQIAVLLRRNGPMPDGTTGRTLICCAFLACAANLLCFIPQQRDPWDDDQGAYLLRAREIQSEGGPPWLVCALFSGEFDESNRHPLYLGLLSLRPDFEAGKRLSAMIGVATLLLTTSLVARRHDAVVAGLFATLLATNFAFCFFSTRVVSEMLVVLFSGAAWLITAQESRREPGVQPGTAGSAWRCAVIGALLGLAWLSKATGLLLLMGYVIWIMLESALRHRDTAAETPPRGRRIVGLICLCAAFLAVGSPLLVRNVRRFGNPFHNVNSLLLFADTYDEFDAMLAADMSTSEAAQDFIGSHPLGEIVSRELTGLVWELFIILRSLGPTPLDDSRILFGAPLALLAIATMAAHWRPEHRLLLVWGLLHWVVFAWYVPIAAGERFVLPLLVPLLATGSEGLVQLWPREGPRSARLLKWLVILWLAGWVAASYASTSLLVPRLS